MATSYDQVPYPCNAYPQTHPAHLALIARLQGMHPVAPEACRYFEIGCGDGANLIPMALEFPLSQFLGIDLAASSIEKACQNSGQFAAANVEFRTQNIMDLRREDVGQWDYIVVHGVFSWVPEPVRLRLLEICRELLTPEGIAFISFNAYPGCHLRAIPREMMRYHTANVPEADSKITQARALMQFVAQCQSSDDEISSILRSEANRVLHYAHNHLYHDDLAALNQPFYLHEFVELVASHGMQYLGDAEYASMFDTRYPVEVRETLASLGDDVVRKEQYLDFIKCRRFRQTLICRSEIKLERTASLDVIKEMLFSSSAKAASPDANLLDDSPVQFLGESDLKGEACAPIAKLALASLGLKWPKRLSFAALHTAVSEAIGSIVDADTLAGALREFIEMGAADAHLQQIRFATTAGERPQVSALTLHQQKTGGNLTSLRHHTVQIRDAFGVWLVGQLDGTQTPGEIAHKLASTVKPDAEGKLDFDKELREAKELVAEGIQKFVQLGFILPADATPSGSGEVG